MNTLKEKLTTLFTNDQWGPVLSITAHRNLKMKGQAFVALESSEKCQKCIKHFKDEIEKNDFKFLGETFEITLAKEDSDLVVETKLSKEEYANYLAEKQEKRTENSKKRTLQQATKKKHKRPKIDLSVLPPNKVLLIQNLPDDATTEQLTEIFSKYHGFLEIRLVKVRNVAFVEYETEDDAVLASNLSEGVKINNHKAVITYAKK